MKKITFLLLCLIASVHTWAQQGVDPEDGGVYRIINGGRDKAVITEDFSTNKLYCGSKGTDKSYSQLWQLIKDGTNWQIVNVYTGRNVQKHTVTYDVYTTNTYKADFYIAKNTSVTGSYYNIMNIQSSDRGLHCQADYAVVPWGKGSGTAGGTEWYFEKVSMTELDIEDARTQYQEYQAVMNNKDKLIQNYISFFQDDQCLQLKSEYASMSDDELKAAMSESTSKLRDIAIKIKNESWATREKEFRVHTYEPYSNPEHWNDTLMVKRYSNLNNPTGIYANSGDLLYVFVGKDIPSSATLQIDAITGSAVSGTRTTLRKGMNIVSASRDASMFFILYSVDTRSGKVIADFDSIPIHIEGGVLNGYWDKARHNDADWVEISQNLATHEYIQVKGDYNIFHMSRMFITLSNCCPTKISDAIGWWDDMATWQHGIMGLEDYYPTKFNNKQCARSLADGYQSAGEFSTNYAQTYISNLLPINTVNGNADNAWGPGHENGHVHQGAINMIATSEVSNNLFSNLTLANLGKYMSRGGTIAQIASAYEAGKSWPSRDGGITLRMFWQLYLHYHMAGNNPDFFPTVFKLMRADRLARKTATTGSRDLLLFAEKCAQAANEDLTDFFEAWGFFVPIDRVGFDDYGTFVINSTPNMIAATKAKLATYPKRAAAIQFIEDRIKPIARTDGGTGNKVTNGVSYAQAGNLGHYTSFLPDSLSIKANGYVYTKSGKKVSIFNGTGAVGFKVYENDSTMLTYGNTYEILLSDINAVKELKFMAVSADGTEVAVKSVSEGSEEDQLAALNLAIDATKDITMYCDSTNKKVGYYITRRANTLIELIDGAKAAIENKDQSEHTYGQWSILIDGAMNTLLSDSNNKVRIKEGNYYKFTNMMYSTYSMIVDGGNGNLNCTEGGSNANLRKFGFIPTGKKVDEYYIQTKTGNFINSIATSVTATAKGATISSALPFTVVDMGKGVFYMQRTGQIMQTIHCAGGKNVVGWDATGTASHWKIDALELNQENLDKDSLNKLIAETSEIWYQIVDTLETTESNIVLKDGVVVINLSLIADIQDMMTESDVAAAMISSNYSELYPEQVTRLSEAIAQVRSGYTVETSIGGIEDEENKKGEIYDINGRRVKSADDKGVYIINGKKQFVE